MPTREQKRAQEAFARVAGHKDHAQVADYKRFCKRFPALIQTCGLAQALAFAESKGKDHHLGFLTDLACVIGECNRESLTLHAREYDLSSYQKLSRDALSAATWLKRYAEALLEGDET